MAIIRRCEGKTQGKLSIPDKRNIIEAFMNASFAGDLNKEWINEPTSMISRAGYVISYINSPIIWCSKLQIEIALSTTENEYVTFSIKLKDVIHLIELLRDFKESVKFDNPSATVYYKALGQQGVYISGWNPKDDKN